jgi:hypothetical protein
MRYGVIVAALFFACLAFSEVKAFTHLEPQAPVAVPKEPATWMINSLSNVHKDPGDEYGHGEGDSLSLIVHGETALGGLIEYEGSQQDPSPICMTGTLRNGILRLQSHPEDVPGTTDQIAIRGKLYPIAHGHAFHGRITGGPFHADPNSTDPHFPAIVTLRAPHDEHDSDDTADSLANGSCACQWKQHIVDKDFVIAKCPATPEQ